ncbi:MAG TPA: DinB family protein, partial [Gemmatimonadales bacterium]|nr:DinB family protein [Gemmatimonadales bacterium]
RDLRAGSLARLGTLRLTEADLARPGLHPALGAVTLGQHLATWVTHDLGHLAQIARTMAKRQAGLVGPWAEYLPILER